MIKRLFLWWWNHPADHWYQFMFPQSGGWGGGYIMGALVALPILIYAIRSLQ